ncbi:hypothetical protein, partial [Caballeronia sp. LZ035]|uniref:hypothetical protein n=1 Tax=Caballeronia sp. LZ035 TaxID=3038568 RepID=UPI0028640812
GLLIGLFELAFQAGFLSRLSELAIGFGNLNARRQSRAVGSGRELFLRMLARVAVTGLPRWPSDRAF